MGNVTQSPPPPPPPRQQQLELQHASTIANAPAWRPLTLTERSRSSSVSCKNTGLTSVVVDIDNLAE